MLKLLIFATTAVCAQALFQCPPNYCDNQLCADVSTCSGRVKTKGGWCGCCDVCLTQLGEGDSCFQTLLLGAPATAECMTGLHCDWTTKRCVKDAAVTVVKRQATVAPCSSRKQQIQQSKQNGMPLIGVEEPNCDGSGYFSPVQCTGSVCYCVDRMGKQLQTFQANRGASANMNCQCAVDLATYMASGLIGKLFDCDTNGNYKPAQTGTQTGIQTGTQTGIQTGTQTGTQTGQTGTGVLTGVQTGTQTGTKLGPCAQKLQGLPTGTSALLGTPRPECDYDGYYRPRQCAGSECYCVRKDGTKIGTYSAPIWQKDHVTCQCARDKDHFESLGILGRIHTCRQNGNYQQYQCLGSGCFCTDNMGNKVGTQSVSIADINNLKCE